MPKSSTQLAAPAQGVPFDLSNLRESETYVVRGGLLFKYTGKTPETPEELPADGELITVLAKQMGRVLLIHDCSYVSKSGPSIRPLEAEAMRLVLKHSSIPVPEVIYAHFKDGHGSIGMTIVLGFPLEKHWKSLDDKTKESLCHQTWDLITKLRHIPQKPERKHLFQCSADGSQTLDPLIEDFQQPPKPLETDSQLRSRIYQRYTRFGGARYKDELLDMLPHSSHSVFTHGDIAP